MNSGTRVKTGTGIIRLRLIAAAVGFALITVGIIICPPASLAQDEPLEWRIEHVAGVKVVEVRYLLSKLKESVAGGDKQAVCGLANYPLQTSHGLINSRSGCEAKYKSIFNRKVVSAIKKQQFEKLFVNSQGVMIGDGEVWMSGVCRSRECKEYDFGIITVNN